ncbi:MAG TPA: ADP-ribosylglycohydrolase family protein [Propionibacteriaceae bacterium]|nr:ADP-ribosylglycohydrolase family protein [Propionibacteriaceae bacterium]
MYDPLSVSDLVYDEFRQRIESGYDVSSIEADLAATAADDLDRLEALYLDLIGTQRRSDWGYEEPDSLDDILDAMPAMRRDLTASRQPPSRELADRILGGWLGRIAGCNLGKPVEDGDFWTPARIRTYLELADAYPLRDYIPALDPMPDGFRLRENWPETTRGRVRGSARDDDIDYSILGVWLLERHGFQLTPSLVANAWLSFLPYLQVFTAERAVLVNLLHRVPIEAAGETRNPYREWIGALIRADVFGWIHFGRPGTAAQLVHSDASLSHRCNGIYAAMWAAALISSACVAATVQEAVEQSLDYVPARSRLAEALIGVHELYRTGCTWEAAVEEVRARFGQYGWVHSINNACLITAGLLWGGGDFSATVGLTVQGGWDTDSNAATAGSAVGTVLGAAKLPGHFIEPLHDRTRSVIFGYDNCRISELARRTTAIAQGAR